jgi:hypothetical protein
MFKIIGVAIMAMSLAACAATSSVTGDYAKGSGKTLVISKSVWSGFQDYATKVSASNPGGFAVLVVGGRGVGYAGYYCPGGHCYGGSETTTAMSRCKQYGAGDCILFAARSEILVNYRVDDE